MLKYNFKYEIKSLIRSRWIQLLSIVLLLLFGFSTYNGMEKVQKRKHDIANAREEVKKNDTMMLKLLDSVARGLDVSVPYWTVPTGPIAVGNYYPRIATMEPRSMAFISTGQADLFTHYVKPTVTGDDFVLNFTEMTSPVQLLFGSFDLAFVIVYLLPLIIIAFSYNVLSAERESGSLYLLASQPIRIQTWGLQKLGLRFFWISILTIGCLTLLWPLFGFNLIQHWLSFLGLLALILSYMLFWFSLAFLINLWVGNSAKNAVSLLGLWVLFVLLMPSVLNQLGNTFYPMPSRTLMINEMRSLKADLTKKQDEILDNFLRDHPEYAISDTTQSRGFYHRYMASQKLVKEGLQPVVNTYEDQLRRQQHWLEQLKWISPAITVQESLSKMAGTSTEDYENFRKQVIAFAETWRAHFMPFLYNNREFSQEDYPNLPKFQFEHESYGNLLVIPVLLLISMGLFGLGLLTSKGLRKHIIIMNS